MRIACLQFAPQVGEIDNNLNRADAVLAKANQNDVDTLDLLVLPELAFSGTVSLQRTSADALLDILAETTHATGSLA